MRVLLIALLAAISYAQTGSLNILREEYYAWNGNTVYCPAFGNGTDGNIYSAEQCSEASNTLALIPSRGLSVIDSRSSGVWPAFCSFQGYGSGWRQLGFNYFESIDAVWEDRHYKCDIGTGSGNNNNYCLCIRERTDVAYQYSQGCPKAEANRCCSSFGDDISLDDTKLATCFQNNCAYSTANSDVCDNSYDVNACIADCESSYSPSASPSLPPSYHPSLSPTSPTNFPSYCPSDSPSTSRPTEIPISSKPTLSPTTAYPTDFPSDYPTSGTFESSATESESSASISLIIGVVTGIAILLLCMCMYVTQQRKHRIQQQVIDSNQLKSVHRPPVSNMIRKAPPNTTAITSGTHFTGDRVSINATAPPLHNQAKPPTYQPPSYHESTTSAGSNPIAVSMQPNMTLSQRIEELHDLKVRGILTENEFKRAKRKLL